MHDCHWSKWAEEAGVGLGLWGLFASGQPWMADFLSGDEFRVGVQPPGGQSLPWWEAAFQGLPQGGGVWALCCVGRRIVLGWKSAANLLPGPRWKSPQYILSFCKCSMSWTCCFWPSNFYSQCGFIGVTFKAVSFRIYPHGRKRPQLISLSDNDAS